MFVPGRTLLFLLSLFAACWLWPVSARAQQPLNRCTGPGGNTIYTDRACASIGATDRLPRGAASAAYRQRRGGCARSVQELIYEITAAIDARDVNRLGSVYHWVGLNAQSGGRILDRLQTIVDRPLVDIVALRGASAPVVADAPVTPPLAAVPPPAENVEKTTAGEAPASPPTVRRAPVGLRLQQTIGKGNTPSQTVLGLQKHLDCWWITF
jgi:hypothetical protein